MAKGLYQGSATVDGGTTENIAPKDTALSVAAQDRIYLHYLNIQVTLAAPGYCKVTDGPGGDVLAILDTSVPFNSKELTYQINQESESGRPLDVGNPLVAEVTGGQVEIDFGYTIR